MQTGIADQLRMPAPDSDEGRPLSARPRVLGKFLFNGAEKLYRRGVTYGPFHPEPTISVDSATEASIVEAVERLMRGRTVFMIAYRLSTLRDCDMRLELSGSAVRVLTAASS
jgi:hypothetical protein